MLKLEILISFIQPLSLVFLSLLPANAEEQWRSTLKSKSTVAGGLATMVVFFGSIVVSLLISFYEMI